MSSNLLEVTNYDQMSKKETTVSWYEDCGSDHVKVFFYFQGFS